MPQPHSHPTALLVRAILLGLLAGCLLALTPRTEAATTAERIGALLDKTQARARQRSGEPRLQEFLDKTPLAEVFPGADRAGPVQGKPAVAEAYAGDKLLGYVYLTSDIVNTRGYSSLPIDVLVGLALDGQIVGARLVEHHEPIVLIGIPDSAVVNFINGYIGLNYLDSPPRPGDPPPVDIVSGATVTLMVVGDSITRSALTVIKAYGSGGVAGNGAGAAPAEPAEQRSINTEMGEPQSWQELLDSGAVGHLRLTVADVNAAFARLGRPQALQRPEPGDPDDEFIDLYAALVSVPDIGRSLLGDAEWNYQQEQLKPGQQAIVVAGNGPYSFKGSGYVRGGIFDRIELIQGIGGVQFSDHDHQRLADLMAAGAPRLREIALFTVPEEEDFSFDPTRPWRLQLMVQRAISVDQKLFTTFSLDYDLPARYVSVEAAAQDPAPAARAGVAAAAPDPVASEGPALWQQMWVAKVGQIVIVSISLVILIGLFFFQDQLVRNEKFYRRFRVAFLLFSLLWLGWYAKAQLSVVNVLTFSHSILMGDFHWDYFLMDPVVFILWVATAVSMIFWNRGAFCGWLCPFGALQELTNKLARLLHVPQVKVPYGVHTRLAGLKYVIFVGLFGVSLYEMALAEVLAEVEPFKTAIILRFMRDWPFVVFAVALVGASLFIERFYCRYMCPLGAAMAIPAKLHIFDWLRRYHMCGNPCQLCAVECPVQAIEPTGQINPNECIQCLNCQQLYHNDQRCPHLIARNKRGRRSRPQATGAVVQAAPQAPRIIMSDT